MRDYFEHIPGFQIYQTEIELKNELSAADLTRVPVFFQ